VENATSLIALLLTMLLTFFRQASLVREEVAYRADRTQLARQVLDRLAAELRGCVGMEQLGFPVEQRLVGDRRSIAFLTTTLPTTDQYVFRSLADELPPARHDLKQVAYDLWADPEQVDEDGHIAVGGIRRIEKGTLNQAVIEEDDPDAVRTDLWSHELCYLEFRYYDGLEWDTQWDLTAGNSLPQMIQITVGFTPPTTDEWENVDLETYPLDEYPLGPDEPNDERYTILVRLPAADRFFGSRLQRLGQQTASQMGVEGMP